MSSSTEIARAVAPSAAIALMECALQRVRDVLVAAGVAERFFAADVLFQCCALNTVYVSGEHCYDFQLFFRNDSSPYLNLQSEDRIEWGKQLPAILGALEGLPLSVTVDNVWRWDDKNRTATGRPTYIPVYRLSLQPSRASAAVFSSTELLTKTLARHCMAEHRLADQQLFDWQQAVIGKTLFQGYRWTPSGFFATFYSKGACTEACESLFKEFDHLVVKEGKGPSAVWHVQVDLTKSVMLES